MHECPYCGQACDCDGEDVWHDAFSPEVENCECSCDGAYGHDDDDLDDLYESPGDAREEWL